MTAVYMDVRHRELVERPLLGGKLNTREALSTYCRMRWPTNTAKQAALEWDLSVDEAKGVVAARASQATVDKVWDHKRGGWPVALSVLAGVIGYGVGRFFAEEAERARDEAERAREEAEALAEVERVAARSFAPAVAAAWHGLADGIDPVADRVASLQGRDRAQALGGRKAGR